jgi:hypothetical protein
VEALEVVDDVGTMYGDAFDVADVVVAAFTGEVNSAWAESPGVVVVAISSLVCWRWLKDRCSMRAGCAQPSVE